MRLTRIARLKVHLLTHGGLFKLRVPLNKTGRRELKAIIGKDLAYDRKHKGAKHPQPPILRLAHHHHLHAVALSGGGCVPASRCTTGSCGTCVGKTALQSHRTRISRRVRGRRGDPATSDATRRLRHADCAGPLPRSVAEQGHDAARVAKRR